MGLIRLPIYCIFGKRFVSGDARGNAFRRQSHCICAVWAASRVSGTSIVHAIPLMAAIFAMLYCRASPHAGAQK
jgi:hypothetical protein